MELIRLFLNTSWQRMILAILAGLCSGASSAGLIALSNITLKENHPPNEFLAVGFFIFCLSLLISTATTQMCISRLTEQSISVLRLRLTHQILACPLRQLEEIGIPRLLVALTQDIEVIASASFFISFLCISVTILLGCFGYLSWLSLPLFCLTLILMPLVILSNQRLFYRGRHFLDLAREEQDNLFKHFQTVTEGIKELKLHQRRRQAFLVEDLQVTAANYRHYRIMSTDSFAISGSWGIIALFIIIGIILFIIPFVFTLPTSVRSGYTLTLLFVFTPMHGLLNTLSELQRANIALKKINTLGLSLTLQKTESEPVSLTNNHPCWQVLQLRSVTHIYRSEREDGFFTIGPLDLTISPGEVIFVVGGNGSGKSTLVKLLTGLYIPETGTINFDGQTITDVNREWYRQQFSVVFSDFYLFERLLGLNYVNCEQQTQDYLKQLQLDHKVKVNNGKFSTTVLSQGQRKRLALVTAYLEDRAIYVFDEWASDQDPAFKRVFYTQLIPELRNRGKAIVVVSHDEHYFSYADRLVKLDYGQVEYDRCVARTSFRHKTL